LIISSAKTHHALPCITDISSVHTASQEVLSGGAACTQGKSGFFFFLRTGVRETALHVSGGISSHHQEHTQLYLQDLVLVKPLLLPAAIAEELELV
jgi:hypothetical protein